MSNQIASSIVATQKTLRKRARSVNSAQSWMDAIIALYGLVGLMGMLIVVYEGGYSLAALPAAGTLAYVSAALLIPSGSTQVRPADFRSLPVSLSDAMPGFFRSLWNTARAWIVYVYSGITAVVGFVILGVKNGNYLAAILFAVMMAVSAVLTVLLAEALVAFFGVTGQGNKKHTVRQSIFLLVIIFGINLVMPQLTNGVPMHRIGLISSFTPFGSAGGVATAVAEGHYLLALLSLVITAATIAVAWALWKLSVAKEMSAMDKATEHAKEKKAEAARSKGLLLPWVTPGPAGAIFSRAFRYWFRDTRMMGSLVTFPILAVFFLLQARFGEPSTIAMYLAIFALFSTFAGINDFGIDGPGLWNPLVAGVPAKTILLARHAASMVVPVVLHVIFALLSLVLFYDERSARLMVVLSFGVLLSGLAGGLLFTTFNPFPSGKPGSNPMTDKSGYNSSAMASSFAVMFLGWVPSAPGIVMAFIGMLAGNTALLAGGIAAALIIPLVCYLLVVRACVKRVRTRMPEIFQKVRQFT